MDQSMGAQEILKGVQPLVGQVIPVRTVQEARPRIEFGDAYVVEVNVKGASKVIKALDSKFPRDSSQSTNHLRRFAKHTQLPETLRSTLIKGEPSSQTIFALIMPPLPDVGELRKVLAPFVPIPPTPDAENPSSSAPSTTPDEISLYTIQVPLLPPLNVPQADNWSAKFWPVVFNPAAPKANIAPPPQILTRTHESIQPKAGYYLALAFKVADEAEQSGRGRRVGAVVVDSELESQIETTGDDAETRWADAVVAVAGDARYSRREAGAMSQSELHLGAGPNPASETYNPDLEGGPELHALMRVVDLIAGVRRQASLEEERPHLNPLEAYFLSKSESFSEDALDESREHSPVAEKYQKTEKEAIPRSSSSGDSKLAPRIRTREHGGYLCTDLDVYLTHEPCVCCSMGMLLSRFRSVTFPRQGRMMTGGLASEPVVAPTADTDEIDEPSKDGPTEESNDTASQSNREYYGLHWRKELNWRALGFEFIENGSSDQGTEKVDFHA
ncbi:putative tRNA-specific adenosine-34 deaminase subunit Tad3 [Aspergillus steynii IBT 23096]|uniref:Putative tRNA-specific adenosine-34 deaminase subunit Tad3 n=1 Tax=Aspergillus steynii IBT 23096 TaxID=1392250 RepID=A0A2I2FXS0_9EURO|nr:putative tRNA-specific adenosine-34 deaminase subunit Tad3 [Aspergillus steynii IBT 23096]PLB45423.1 putative tRNA-specific adenosine-34 deaminase subunit Tad3 [Aspergillus steynii IBT 23096]